MARTEEELKKRRIDTRNRWLEDALQGKDGWICDGEEHFGGGRRCVCGRRVYNAFVLYKVNARGKRVEEIHVGARCAISALAYITGGLRNGQPQ